MANARIEKINAELQRAISSIINNNLKDPRLAGAMISVLKVDTSGDLSHAKIYVSIFNAEVEQVFNIIKSSLPYIRRQTAKKVNLRIMPELHFKLDDSLEYANKIEGLLNKINKK